MSRLRRRFLYNRHTVVTVDLLSSRGKLEERDFGRLAIALARMNGEVNKCHYVFPLHVKKPTI